jgi:peptidyl-prolyl cis-trans isomerase B (cyclophilin B)
MMKKKISIIAASLSLIMMFTGCKSSSSDTTNDTGANPELTKTTITATISLEDYDDITLELYPDLAPETVENFVELAEDGFYDGTIFHRVIDNFMIQGGGYDENLKELKASSIKGEFAENGFENSLSHVRGVISMARTQDKDSASSQFFIVQKDSTYLDGKFAAFGKVTDGMDVVDEIASVRTGSVASAWLENVPIEPIVIKTITIDSGSSSSKSSKKSSKKSTPTPTAKAASSPSTTPASSPQSADSTAQPVSSDLNDLPVVSSPQS